MQLDSCFIFLAHALCGNPGVEIQFLVLTECIASWSVNGLVLALHITFPTLHIMGSIILYLSDWGRTEQSICLIHPLSKSFLTHLFFFCKYGDNSTYQKYNLNLNVFF